MSSPPPRDEREPSRPPKRFAVVPMGVLVAGVALLTSALAVGGLYGLFAAVVGLVLLVLGATLVDRHRRGV